MNYSSQKAYGEGDGDVYLYQININTTMCEYCNCQKFKKTIEGK